MKATVCDAFYITVLKSLRFHLSALETERFQNDAFSKDSCPLLKPFSNVFVFISVFGRFSVDGALENDRRKRIKTYAFSNENALVWMGP